MLLGLLWSAGCFMVGRQQGQTVLTEWQAAAARQQADARVENEQRNAEVVNGWNAAVAVLRRRLDAGWRPGIPAPRSAGLPAGGAPGAAGGTDATAGDDLPAAARIEAATCAAARERLIEDGALCALQVQGLQVWADVRTGAQ
jgi:hypothetical protein